MPGWLSHGVAPACESPQGRAVLVSVLRARVQKARHAQYTQGLGRCGTCVLVTPHSSRGE